MDLNKKCNSDPAQGESEKSNVTKVDSKTGMQIKKALHMQLEVQRHLHEKLERKLLLRIEEQGKQLKMIFDQQQTTSLLDTQNSNISSPGNDLSNPYDDTEVLDAEHRDNTHFPFQSFLLAGASETRNSPNNVVQIDSKTGMQIKEALQMQLEVQRHLHDQLEIQRKLQLRIEEQGKQLKMMFDQQQKTTRSVLDIQNSSISTPGDDPSTPCDDTDVLVAEGSDNTAKAGSISLVA
ncbi:uncharacterized protein LOC107789305 isoform X2 [Nicotiana tabacum]|uniref:Uncharacterized protein LOC107789305 isoform X2 n=2 Tax=Nicotiana TaxID=4085 RepID=A0A1S3ZQC7_TOBAC|nr:PREDICTED: uncharacterized protein LOC104219113 isoform X2 [Nicotiana sylvestris]XP_016466567.1 PREDICTED: uncharacterized protein LOC107789305 isoform X2 [Nicotiana tabacum]